MFNLNKAPVRMKSPVIRQFTSSPYLISGPRKLFTCQGWVHEGVSVSWDLERSILYTNMFLTGPTPFLMG